MKFEIKHDSWHMWLANFTRDPYVQLDIGDKTDICRYMRLVIMGALRVLLFTLVAIALTSFVFFCVGNIIGWLFMGYKLEGPVVLTIFTFLACVVLLGIAYGKAKWDDYQRDQYWKRIENGEHHKPRKPGFIGLVYKKFKEKTCFKLEIK